MSPETARTRLAASPLFHTGAAADADAVLARMKPVQFRAGQLIFSAGDRGEALYLVVDGRVKLSVLTSDGRELSLAHAGPGDIFGEIAALDGGPRTTDATALVDTAAMLLPQAALKTLIAENHRIATAVMGFMCMRLRVTDQKLEAIALHSIEVRLARFLLATAEAQSNGILPPQAKLELNMSQTDLGLLIGASRPKVNAALAVLENDGAIRRNDAAMTVDIARLRRCGGLAEID